MNRKAPIPASPAEEDYARLGDDAAPISGVDPIALFEEWLALAARREPGDANAMTLATVDAEGAPDARMVLLKGVDEAGFVFYTNTESAKGEELAAHPAAALVFHWKSIRRQVRVRGAVTPVSAAEADAYFATRAWGAKIGAWASDQSRPLVSPLALEERVAGFSARFGLGDVPRPPHWSGLSPGAPDHRVLAQSALPSARAAALHPRRRSVDKPAPVSVNEHSGMPSHRVIPHEGPPGPAEGRPEGKLRPEMRDPGDQALADAAPGSRVSAPCASPGMTGLI